MTGVAAIIKRGAPNMATWGRDATDSVFGKTIGDKYNCLYGLHQKFIGLDCQVTNNGAVLATIMMDGVQYNIPSGATKQFENHPFSEIVITAGVTVDLELDGILYDTAKDLNLINEGGLSIWR